MASYMRWLAVRHSHRFETYNDLWRWSIDDLEGFWQSIVEFFNVEFQRPAERVLADRSMPGARWFSGAHLNYAQNAFRNAAADRPALVYQSERRPLSEMSWAELERQVASVASALRKMGVRPGDRVAAYMPNIPEAAVAFLAAASVGAVWSSCPPEFGPEGVLDRFRQIGPRVLFAVDGYRYNGRIHDRRAGLAETLSEIGILTTDEAARMARQVSNQLGHWRRIGSLPSHPAAAARTASYSCGQRRHCGAGTTQ